MQTLKLGWLVVCGMILLLSEVSGCPDRPCTCNASATIIEEMNSQGTDLGYSLNVTRTACGTNDYITVTLVGDKPFVGILMYVEIDETVGIQNNLFGARVGWWNIPGGGNYQEMSPYCNVSQGSTLGHANSNYKDSGVSFTWNSPGSTLLPSLSGTPLKLHCVVALSRSEWQIIDPMELTMFPVTPIRLNNAQQWKMSTLLWWMIPMALLYNLM